MTPSDLALLVVLAGLVVLLFVLAMVEAALLHARRSAVAAEAAEGDPASRRLLALLDDLPAVMNTVLLAVLLVQVTSTAIAAVLAQRWVGGAAITISTAAVTVVLFIYGEAIPKTIAIADPVRHARRFGRLVGWLRLVLGPVVAGLVRVARLQYRGELSAEAVSAVSETELLHLTGEAAAAGRIEASDAELIERSLTLGDLRVDQILIPIAEVVSVDASTPVSSALQTAIATGHRRLVVYEGTPDNVVGFVRLRDLADPSTSRAPAAVADAVRDAITVSGTALVIDVLRSMQRRRCHLAVVGSPGGGAAGIVTVEDIVEELLGRIDEPEPDTGPAGYETRPG